MKSRGYIVLSCLTLALFFGGSGSVLAQSPAQQIQKMESRQLALQQQLQELKSESHALSSTMAKIEPTDGPEKAAFDAAVSNFEQASETFEQDPSLKNKSQLRSAELKMHLAERKYRSANSALTQLDSELTAVEDKISAVRQELSYIDKQLPALQQQLASQRDQVAAQQRQAAAAQERRADETRKRQQEEAARATAARATVQAKAPPSPVLKVTGSAATQSKYDLDQGFTLLTSKQEALTAQANLTLRVGENSHEIRSKKILNVEHYVDGNPMARTSHRFVSLGNEQYRANASFEAGENRVNLAFSHWSFDFPKEYANVEVTVLLDASVRGEPKIICFPSSLIN